LRAYEKHSPLLLLLLPPLPLPMLLLHPELSSWLLFNLALHLKPT
jgi:hypothetical protein